MGMRLLGGELWQKGREGESGAERGRVKNGKIVSPGFPQLGWTQALGSVCP